MTTKKKIAPKSAPAHFTVRMVMIQAEGVSAEDMGKLLAAAFSPLFPAPPEGDAHAVAGQSVRRIRQGSGR